MKNVLMIVPFFPPNAGGGVYRSLAFVKYLERYGWRATVIAPRPDSFWIFDESLSSEVPPSCKVHRTNSLSGQYLLSLIGRSRGKQGRPQVRSSRRFSAMRKIGALGLVPDTYIGWYPFAWRLGKRLLREGNFDAIYSTSPPETSHLIAHKLQRISRLPWVADFRDPWMNLYLLQPPTRFHARLHQRLERKVCSQAAIITTSRWHHDILKQKYPDMRRVTLISNGYDGRKLAAHSQIEPRNDYFRILHTGMLTQKRSAVPFLRGLRIFFDGCPEAEKQCRVAFVGPRESENEITVGKLGLDDVVEFRDTTRHDESLKLQRESHILLLIKHLDPVYRGIVPGKLYEYLGARRPILALVPDGEVRDVIERFRRGEVAPQEDPSRIAAHIDLMYRRYAAGTLDTDYDLSAVSEFDRENLTARLAEYLDSVLRDWK